MTVYIVTNCYGETMNVYANREDALKGVRGIEDLEDDGDNDPDVITEWDVR